MVSMIENNVLDGLKNISGFSTKIADKLPGVFSDVVARRKGAKVVPLKRAPDAEPKCVILICPISRRSSLRLTRSADPWSSDKVST